MITWFDSSLHMHSLNILDTTWFALYELYRFEETYIYIYIYIYVLTIKQLAFKCNPISNDDFYNCNIPVKLV